MEPDPDQPRKKINPGYLKELTQSVRELGILQPVTVRYVEEVDRYRIISGECRYTAAGAAGLAEIPCWVKRPKADEILLEQLVENWQRSDLNPFELADSLAILRDANQYTQRQLAERTGKSAGEISRILTILELEPAVQKVARDDTSGRVSKRHLYSLGRLNPQQQGVVLQRVIRDRLSAEDTERIVQRVRKAKNAPARPGAPVTYRKFATKFATVRFTYRKKEVTDTDLLHTLKEIQRQIIERSGDPRDFQ